jgi:DNA-binding transcriptional LysR family regulator
MLELRLLHSFVAVAELEHVGRAAERLHISQSPLSRQMHQLEKELNLKLFEREGRRVRLTEGGRRFLVAAQGLLEHGVRLEREAARLAAGEVGRVTIGFVRSALWDRVLSSAVRTFRLAQPGVRIELKNLRSSVQLEALLRGEIDLALVHRVSRSPELHAELLYSDPLVLAIPADHPLATRRRLTPADLDGRPWVVLAQSSNPGAHERLIAACAKAGFVPTLSSEASDLNSSLALVEAGVGLALVPTSASRPATSAVVFRTPSWLGMSWPVFLVRRSTDESVLSARLAAVLRRTARR